MTSGRDRVRPDRWRAARRAGSLATVLVPLAFVGLLFVWPVVRIVAMGLAPDGRPALGDAWAALRGPRTRDVVAYTAWLATVSTVATMALALPGAYLLSRYRFRGRDALAAAVTVPFVLPSVVVATAITATVGPHGLTGSWFTLTGSTAGIVVAHVFFNYGLVVRTVGGLLGQIDPAYERAARSLGATRRQVITAVLWPLVRPAVWSAAALTFLFCSTSFGVVLVLGSRRHATIEVAIKQAALDRLDLPEASVLAVVQLVMVALLSWVAARGSDSQAVRQRLVTGVAATRALRSTGARLFAAANAVVVAVLLGLPVVALVERSLRTRDGYGLAAYRRLSEVPQRSSLFVPPAEAITNSLRTAAVAAVVAVVVGGCAALALAGPATARAGGPSRRSRWARRGLEVLLMVPLGTSAVTVGLGFLVALDRPPLDLRNSWLLVPLAQALLAVPFVVRFTAPVLRAIEPRQLEAARLLGAGPFRAWRATAWPLVRRALLASAGFAFAISMGEFGATLVLARADEPTIPVALYNLLARPSAGNFTSALAMATILLVVTGACMYLIEAVGRAGRHAR